MMHFDMRSPCDNCPFRTDVVPYLRVERVIELAHLLQQRTFICHKSIHCEQPRDEKGRFARRIHQHCAGVLIVMEKSESLGSLQQIAERLGLYDPSQMNLNAPVYENFDQMIQAHGS